MILSEKADRLRVLLVEDDQAVADTYRYKLELDGYAVDVTPGGMVLDAAEELSPDLIFLNVQVPNLEGALALEELRLNERTSGVPVVILTEHDRVDLLRHGFVLGPLDHVIDTSTLTESKRRRRPSLQVVPGSEPVETSTLMSGYFSSEP